MYLILFGFVLQALSALEAQAQITIIPDPISISWVEDRVNDGRIQSIEQLLEQLPPSYASQYTLMTRSRSRQATTATDPRVIFYGPQASFILAVNGGAKGVEGANLAEMIQFNSVERKFEFFELEDHGGFVTLKPGEKCTDCHRADPRPNWQPYSRWPGALAAFDDNLGPGERDWIRDFKLRAATHPRYKWLAKLEERYEDRNGMQESRPNIRFTQRIMTLNQQRLVRLIQATPDYDKFKYSILGTMICRIPNSIRFFPVAFQNVDPTEYYGDFGVRGNSTFFALFERRGISTLDWSMAYLPEADAREGNPDYVIDEFQMPGHSVISFAGALVAQDPELQIYATLEASIYHGAPEQKVIGQDCGGLEKAASAALKGWVPPSGK